MDQLSSVLYVEDDTQSRKLMSMLLTGRMKLPHVTIFEDSENFVERITALDPKPDIIFLDIHVKPYSGFEMLKILRDYEWGSKIPIVALTASVMNEEIYQLRTAGFNGCLAKPIHLASFPATIERILLGETIWRVID